MNDFVLGNFFIYVIIFITLISFLTLILSAKIMAGIDAEGNKDGQNLRETYNVTGFPKTVYFK